MTKIYLVPAIISLLFLSFSCSQNDNTKDRTRELDQWFNATKERILTESGIEPDSTSKTVTADDYDKYIEIYKFHSGKK